MPAVHTTMSGPLLLLSMGTGIWHDWQAAEVSPFGVFRLSQEPLHTSQFALHSLLCLPGCLCGSLCNFTPFVQHNCTLLGFL